MAKAVPWRKQIRAAAATPPDGPAARGARWACAGGIDHDGCDGRDDARALPQHGRGGAMRRRRYGPMARGLTTASSNAAPRHRGRTKASHSPGTTRSRLAAQSVAEPGQAAAPETPLQSAAPEQPARDAPPAESSAQAAAPLARARPARRGSGQRAWRERQGRRGHPHSWPDNMQATRSAMVRRSRALWWRIVWRHRRLRTRRTGSSACCERTNSW